MGPVHGYRLKRALSDPTAIYGSPEDVAHDATLTRAEKLAVLASWEADARELAVAEEENMGGGEPSRLQEIMAARLRMAGEAVPSTGPHKQGGAAADGSALRVGHFMRPAPEAIHADHELEEAALRLSPHEWPILPVADGDEIVGVIARPHVARAREAVGSARTAAREIMTAEVAFCYTDDAVSIARALMDRHACNHLLVISADQTLVGILARDDLPSVGVREADSIQGRPEVVEPREGVTGVVAATVQPGGLDVYSERPRIKARSTTARRS